MSRIRVLVLGDEQVGKTSIIRTFISQSFPQEVPKFNPPVVIPPELSRTCSTFTVIDLYCKPYLGNKDQLTHVQSEVSKADVFILVYDITRTESLESVFSFWVPLIKEHSAAPCILVGNKNDLPKMTKPVTEVSKSLLDTFEQCQIAIESSAKSFINIARLFQYAEQAVLYPTGHLIHTSTKQLTQNFIMALKTIFRIADKDNNLLLSDLEMDALNQKVFGIKLTSRDLEKLKKLVTQEEEQAVFQNEFTFKGFLKLQELFIRELRSSNCWKLLEHFGFTKNLELPVRVSLPEDNVEFSVSAVQFLEVLFTQHSESNLLSFEGIKEIFSTVSKPLWSSFWEEYSNYIYTNQEKSISLQNWMSLWHLMLRIQPENTLKYLVWLGYSQEVTTTYLESEKRNVEKPAQKKVFVISLVGEQGVGRESLMRSFLYKPTSSPISNQVCSMIEEKENIWDSKFLVLTKVFDHKADVVCLIYDGSSSSMNYLREEVVPNLTQDMPRLLVLNRHNQQAESESAYSFSLELGLREHAQIDLSKQRPDSLFLQLKDIAQHPYKGILRLEKKRDLHPKESQSYVWGLAALGAAAVGALLLKNVKFNSS